MCLHNLNTSEYYDLALLKNDHNRIAKGVLVFVVSHKKSKSIAPFSLSIEVTRPVQLCVRALEHPIWRTDFLH